MAQQATAQMVEEVANTPVPKQLTNAAGKRMSIRELFNTYDADGEPGLNKEELSSLLNDLEVLEGLGGAAVQARPRGLKAPPPGFNQTFDCEKGYNSALST